jgi:hypothetical protein
VKHVMGRHQDAHMSASIFPSRMDSGKEYLNLLLTVISDDVLIIGISGMDKTLIAKAVYNQNFLRFERQQFPFQCKHNCRRTRWTTCFTKTFPF